MSRAMTNAATFYQQAVETGTKIFATAPMIDWSSDT
jgi:tRNA-dihydrouridine synthase A